MLFNSHIFILFFLPVCLLGYFWFNYLKKYSLAQVFLLVMSLWFYAYFNTQYLVIILVSIIFNYGIYLWMEKLKIQLIRKMILIFGLIVNIGSLFYFKYMDFLILNINRMFSTRYELLKIVLPLGISFFTFQQISFIIDSYRGEVPKYNLLYYSCYVSFFPQLVAGPIVTHSELIPQFMDENKKKIDWCNISQGLYIFVIGLAKKVLLADTFGKAVNWGYLNVGSLDATNAIIVMLSYTMQIYFDFSGYGDMAIGIAKLFNINLPVNFNSPYKALTITEFWSRWHMTLTRFLQKYVYIPLGGNRNGKIRTYINVVIVFFISGLWHGAGWSFVLWGIFHGIFSVITRCFKGFFLKLHPALNWMITFGFLNVTWVFFRSNSVSMALRVLNSIVKLHFGEINNNILSSFKFKEIELFLQKTPIEASYPYFSLMIFLLIAFLIILGAKNAYEKMKCFKPTVFNSIIMIVLIIWCFFSLSGVSTFLYFNF